MFTSFRSLFKHVSKLSHKTILCVKAESVGKEDAGVARAEAEVELGAAEAAMAKLTKDMNMMMMTPHMEEAMLREHMLRTPWLCVMLMMTSLTIKENLWTRLRTLTMRKTLMRTSLCTTLKTWTRLP